jgi:quinol monooxygenase YgiN
MAFVQIIDYTTSRFDEIRALAEKLRAGGEGGPAGAQRVTVAQDRDKPGHYITIAEFESYEKAMENSNHPATQEFAAAMAQLVDGPPTFYNLDVEYTM